MSIAGVRLWLGVSKRDRKIKRMSALRCEDGKMLKSNEERVRNYFQTEKKEKSR